MRAELSEIAALRGGGTTKADTLLAQARDVGLSDVVPDSWEATVAALRAVGSTPLANLEIAAPDNTEFARLSDERARLLAEQRRLSDEINAVRAFETDGVGFSREATEQRARLKSIGLFAAAPVAQNCPLCSQARDSTEAAPGIDQVKDTLASLSSRLDSASRAAPQIEKAVGELETRLQGVRQRIATNRANLEAIRSDSRRRETTQPGACMLSGESACILRACLSCPTRGPWSKRRRICARRASFGSGAR